MSSLWGLLLQMLQLLQIIYTLNPHTSGPIIGLATSLGLFVAITVALSTVLLVLHVKNFKKWRNEKGKYLNAYLYVCVRDVWCSLSHFGLLQNPRMLTWTMTFP